MFNRNTILIILFLQMIFHSLFSQDNVKLVFSNQRGFYETQFELNIYCESEGAIIKYTLDGSNPFTSSTAINSTSPAKILIDPSVITNRDKAPGYIVTACAILNDTLASDIITHTYIFPNKIIELSPNNQVPGQGWLTPGTNA